MNKNSIRLARALLLLLGLAAAPHLAAHGEESDDHQEASAADQYAPLAWLVGDWRGTFLPEGRGTPPTMRFEASGARGFMRYSSVKPDGSAEYEGMIVWHPVEKRFVFLKSYATTGPVLMETGWIDLLEGGAVRFNMHTHYTPGIGLPWSHGAKAGPEGTTLRFRRTLAPEGDDTLFGEFVMERGGEWVRPQWEMEVGPRGFEWRRY